MNENKENVPKLRFPGFTDGWEKRRLGDLVTQVIREVPKPSEPYYRISVRSHAKGTFHQKVDDPSEVAMDKLYIVKENDLIVNITFAWEHAIAVAKKEDDGLLVSHRFPTYRADENSDIKFMHYLVSREYFRKKLEFISPGGAGRNRVLNKEDFLRISEVVPPTIEEQKNIGSFLAQIDNLITLHHSKLNNVKNLKAGLLQKMFPKAGEDFPEVRFPGFTDAWEQRKLGELASFTKGIGYTKGDLKENGSPIILYGRMYTDYKTLIEDVDTFVDVKENSVISLGGEVIVPSSGESADDIARASAVGKPGIVLGGDLNIIKPSEQINPVFLAMAISNGTPNRELAKRAQGKSVVHLHNSDLKNINLVFPQIDEQKKIVDLNLQLDHLIALHQRKLKHLQEQKKALLQQMFV